MNTGDSNTEKALKTVSRKTTVAQYLSSSSSASQVQMTQSYCSYPHRTCMRNKLEGFDYCIRHILEDRNAPYRQCSYVSSRTGHKCSEAALRTEKRESYCSLHARKMARSRHQDGRRRSRQDDPALNLLTELESHVGTSCRQPSGRPIDTYATDDNMSTCSVDEADFQPLQDQLVMLDAADSDAESVDSEQENALKHAGVYTAEEIALVFRDKLIRLQSLYIDQFKRLHHRLREKRRQYLHTMRRTFPTSAAETGKTDSKCESDQQTLRALSRYYRRFGKEALLVQQCKERRIAFSEGAAYKPSVSATCKHGDACSAPALPLSNYCLQHIQDDSQQVLFTTCNFASGVCKRIVPAIFAEQCCHLHTKLQPVTYHCSSCEHDSPKEEPVDIVSVGDIHNNETSASASL